MIFYNTPKLRRFPKSVMYANVIIWGSVNGAGGGATPILLRNLMGFGQ